MTLKHIIGLMQPDAGRIFVEGDEVQRARRGGAGRASAGAWDSCSRTPHCSTRSRSARTSRFRCGVIPLTVRREIRERARQKLADVGLERDYDKMPADLSGGMRKRAGLARAMALDPSILLVDEPSAGLDPITPAEIDEPAARPQAEGTTLVVVTHNIPSARTLGDELMLLHEGRIARRARRPSSSAARIRWSMRSCARDAAGRVVVCMDRASCDGAGSRVAPCRQAGASAPRCRLAPSGSGSSPAGLAARSTCDVRRSRPETAHLSRIRGDDPNRLAGLGAFVIGGILLFAIGLFLIGERRMLFQKKFTVYTQFTRISGLQPGAPVKVNGMGAGEVETIEVPLNPAGKFRVRSGSGRPASAGAHRFGGEHPDGGARGRHVSLRQRRQPERSTGSP